MPLPFAFVLRARGSGFGSAGGNRAAQAFSLSAGFPARVRGIVVFLCMSKATSRRLGFEVDKMSNSIEEIRTGNVCATRLVRLYPSDAEMLSSLEWQFDWSIELRNPDHEVCALTTTENPGVFQGLISISDMDDHVFMDLLESAPFNIGRDKEHMGVASNLVAFACYRAFKIGYDGVVAFEAKTKLIGHYETTLGAKLIAGNRMFINTPAAHTLVNSYLKNFDEDQLQETG